MASVIRWASGDLFDAEVEALVNTVNCAGVMGKGLAAQFKRVYPAMFEDYSRAARVGEVRLGRMHVWPGGSRLVINFPTKAHWRDRSYLADIDSGLADLVRVLRVRAVASVAIPALGCGNGRLLWTDVEPRISKALAAVPDVDAHVYAP